MLTMVAYTVPGMKPDDADKVNGLLQDRLNSLNDLALTLKHIHWNVTGPHFIAVHTMLDPQVDAVRLMVDDTAERIAALERRVQALEMGGPLEANTQPHDHEEGGLGGPPPIDRPAPGAGSDAPPPATGIAPEGTP